ncbi:disease resistance-like protein DSC1 [Neltuma alba]|uniref:disease resistance-like protein DSC1 n=1 Tax=Neltuma alba TaxID=207710 RepID=UPI0010A2E683|nr:disease resistance-like protein DSC1 [Prosopis alba]
MTWQILRELLYTLSLNAYLREQEHGEAEIECRAYKGFFPIDKERCRSGGSGRVDLTLHFPTTNTIGKVTIHSKETSFVDLEIVDCGWRLVCKKDLDPSSARIRHDKKPSKYDPLVGDIQSKVDEIISLSMMELGDTRFIRISGESGIGKTTLARLVYDAIRSKFDATCFLDNVREDSERFGIVSLQMKLLSVLGLGEHVIDDISKGAEIIRKFLCHKKVLIILDAVSHESQVENLARNKEWFGAGSKIVIITAGGDMLSTLYRQIEEYKVERLGPDESLKLLYQEAFKKDEPEQAYLDFSKKVIEYACGLPLVLKVLGSFLCGKDANEWKNASKRRPNSR